MSELRETTVHEVVCPHCRKPFQAELIPGRAARYQGFKCPHCRLFVPSERVLPPAGSAESKGGAPAPPPVS